MAKKKKSEQPAEPKQERKEVPKVPKERNPLLTLLSILLVLVGMSELALWGFFGFSSFQASRALREYEAQQKTAAEERAARGGAAGSAYGPRLKVENGQVTWRLEDDERLSGSVGGGVSSGTSASQGGGAQTDASVPRVYIPRIPYALAEQKTAGQPSAQGTKPLGDGDSTSA